MTYRRYSLLIESCTLPSSSIIHQYFMGTTVETSEANFCTLFLFLYFCRKSLLFSVAVKHSSKWQTVKAPTHFTIVSRRACRRQQGAARARTEGGKANSSSRSRLEIQYLAAPCLHRLPAARLSKRRDSSFSPPSLSLSLSRTLSLSPPSLSASVEPQDWDYKRENSIFDRKYQRKIWKLTLQRCAKMFVQYRFLLVTHTEVRIVNSRNVTRGLKLRWNYLRLPKWRLPEKFGVEGRQREEVVKKFVGSLGIKE